MPATERSLSRIEAGWGRLWDKIKIRFRKCLGHEAFAPLTSPDYSRFRSRVSP